jgi:hypothetical protein
MNPPMSSRPGDAMPGVRLKIEGLEAVKKAFKELEPKLARRVIKQAETKALAPIKAAEMATAPELSGKLKRSIRISSVKTGSPTYCRPRPLAEIRIIYVTCILVLRPRNPSRCRPSHTDFEHASASTCAFNCRQSGSQTASSEAGVWMMYEVRSTFQ